MTTLADSSSSARDRLPAPLHGAGTRARSWTGRAVVSRSTASTVPRVRTIATHKTRVSEMRLISRANDSFDMKASLAPAAVTVGRTGTGRITREWMLPRFGRHASG